MKRYGSTLLRACLLTITFIAQARELRMPWTLTTWDGFIHYKEPRPKDDDTCWNVDWWGSGYYKTADKCYTNNSSLKTESLAGVWFGAENFTALNAFAPGSYSASNPFLGVFQISPRFDFNENGAFLGMTVDRGYCCGRWHFGGRVRLAVRNIKVALDSCCDLEENLNDVRIIENELVQSNSNIGQSTDGSGLEVINNSWAYRLDFVAALPVTVNAPIQKLLSFKAPLTVGAVNLTLSDPTETGVGTPVHVAQRPSGTTSNGIQCPPEIAAGQTTAPYAPFALVNEPGNGKVTSESELPFLNASGTGTFELVENNNRAIFQTTTDYTPLGNDPATQRGLWLVPTAYNMPNTAVTKTTLNLTQSAQTVGTAIENALKNLNANTSSIAFLENQCITFDTQRISGLADMDLWLYAQRIHCWGYWLVETGMRFPTGKRLNYPNKVLLQVAPGNNGHFELMFGGELGWEACDWLNIELGGYFSHAFKRKEKVAASFAGATIKNIGPTVPANVAWTYFDGNLDFTFRVPCNPRMGVTYGYELYVKGKDKISFETTTATDLLGVVQPLDPSVLAERTNVISNRFRAEGFFQGEYGEVYAGWSRVFAGKNALREAEYYLGLVAYF